MRLIFILNMILLVLSGYFRHQNYFTVFGPKLFVVLVVYFIALVLCTWSRQKAETIANGPSRIFFITQKSVSLSPLCWQIRERLLWLYKQNGILSEKKMSYFSFIHVRGSTYHWIYIHLRHSVKSNLRNRDLAKLPLSYRRHWVVWHWMKHPTLSRRYSRWYRVKFDQTFLRMLHLKGLAKCSFTY